MVVWVFEFERLRYEPKTVRLRALAPVCRCVYRRKKSKTLIKGIRSTADELPLDLLGEINKARKLRALCRTGPYRTVK